MEISANLTAMAPASFFPTLPLSFPNTHIHTCTICMDILDQPIELLCGSLVCLLCCNKWLTINRNGECPCCFSPLQDHARSPSRVTMDMLGSQLVECPRGCNRTVKVELYLQHLQSRCQAFFEHSTHSPSRTTIRDILEKDTESLTTQAEKKVAKNIIKRLMTENKDGEMLQLPTGGQVNMQIE